MIAFTMIGNLETLQHGMPRTRMGQHPCSSKVGVHMYAKYAKYGSSAYFVNFLHIFFCIILHTESIFLHKLIFLFFSIFLNIFSYLLHINAYLLHISAFCFAYFCIFLHIYYW